MEINFTGKRVLVTGGTRGIGRGIVQAFLDSGASVAVNGSTEASVARAIREIGNHGRLVAAPGTLSDVTECRKVVAASIAGLGGLDVLVNSAGRASGGPVELAEEALWNEIIDVNLKGMFFVTKYSLPYLRASKGCIVNIASVFGLIGVANNSIYGASKAAVINMTRCHALEFAPDIRVNAVCPGGVDTDMLRKYAVKLAGSVEAGYELLSRDCAQKRIGQVHEIAGPVLYLASDLSSFVTGSIHVVDGGEVID